MSRFQQLKLTAEARWIKGMQVEVSIRGFPKISLDQPPLLHGSDTAPGPGDYLLAAVGGCLTMSYIFCLQKYDVKTNGVSVDLEGVIERVEGLLRYTNIKADFYVKTPNDSEKLRAEECFQKFQKYCIVGESIKKGIPVKLELTTSVQQ